MRRAAPLHKSRGDVRVRTAVTLGLLSLATGIALATHLPGPSSGAASGAVSTSHDIAPAAALVAEQGPGPEGDVDGMPSGFERTREGAVAAAAAYVTTGQLLLDLDPLSAERAVRRIAASGYADRFAAATMRQLQAARDALADGSGPIMYRQAVVAHRVESFDADRARVAIWNVGVLAREGVAPPQAGWSISTFELLWEDGDWRIWAETIVPGPAPILNDSVVPATTRQLAGSLEGFVDFASRG